MKSVALVIVGCLVALIVSQTGVWAASKGKRGGAANIDEYRIAYIDTVKKKNAMGEEIEAESTASSKLTIAEIRQAFAGYAKGGKVAFSATNFGKLSASMDVVLDYNKFPNAKDISRLLSPGATLKMIFECNAKVRLCEPIQFFGEVLHYQTLPGEAESLAEYEVVIQINKSMLYDVMQTGKIEYLFRFAPADNPMPAWPGVMDKETATMLKKHFPNTPIIREVPPKI